jgi:hypothetical protein
MLQVLKSESVQVFRRLDEDLSASADSRRLKSAKARNRGRMSTVGAASYGELASRRTVAMVDFGGRKWLGRAVEWYARLFGRPERGSKDWLMFALEDR